MTTTMNASKISQACVALLLLAMIASFSAAAWAQAGYVHALSGSATSQRGSERAVSARLGDTFEVDTVFTTGANSRLTLKFSDGQVLALAPRSRVRIQQYRFDPRNIKAGTLAIRLLDGALRFVGGAIAKENRDAVRITAGESLLSILRAGGIDFSVAVDTKGQEVGVAAVALGEIGVRTPYGPIIRIEADQAVPWRPGTTPPPPIPIAAAPAAIQAELAGLRSMVLPGNAPVAIDIAARAVVESAGRQQPDLAAKPIPASAGYVHALTGLAVAQGPDGRAVQLSAGDAFEPGTRFNTAENGRVVLKFADGQVLVLGASSSARVEQYRYDERNVGASHLAIALQDGTMRFVGGVIAAENREAVRITVGDSLINVLRAGGIDFTVSVDTKGQEVGVAAVASGEVGVRTPYGPIIRIAADQAVPWRPGSTPPPPVPIAAERTATQAELAELRSMALPANTPVAVDLAAAAAVSNAGPLQLGLAAKTVPGTAGYVHALSGSALAQGPAGGAVPVSVGDAFNPGTTFNTAEDGVVVLKFADGQVIVLGNASTARVEQYHFDERKIVASGTSVELVNGAMRFVGGTIATAYREGVRLTAGESMVQILSIGPLDFSVVVDTRTQETGVAAVTAGEIALRTPYGRINKIQPNEAAPWQPGGAPRPPVSLSEASTGEITALLSASTPENTPVAVEAMAKAAGAAAQEPSAKIIESTLAALAAPAAGPADFSAPVAVPVPVVVTPGGGGGRCVGSPC